MDFFDYIALIVAIILPFFNIPLIGRMIKRKSSQDISLIWAIGVWTCILLMAPSSFTSDDVVWRIFNMINFVFFSIVLITALNYRRKKYVRRYVPDA